MAGLQRSPRLRPGGIPYCLNRKKLWYANKIRKEGNVLGLGLVELIIILAIIFFIFGGRKIPQLSKGFGLAIRNFKKGLHEPDAIDVTPKKENPPAKRT